VEYLRRNRLTLELKCADLDAEQMARRPVPPSTMSLLGLVRHLAEVERHWFRREMAGQDAPSLYRTDGDRDGDWNWAVADADRFVADAVDLDVSGTSGMPLREVLVHMIEEYARPCGHADLLRERIDGRVGE
jgi:uncharacterized damage-inducible protein DinB